jgi:hypothetical protein
MWRPKISNAYCKFLKKTQALIKKLINSVKKFAHFEQLKPKRQQWGDLQGDHSHRLLLPERSPGISNSKLRA